MDGGCSDWFMAHPTRHVPGGDGQCLMDLNPECEFRPMWDVQAGHPAAVRVPHRALWSFSIGVHVIPPDVLRLYPAAPSRRPGHTTWVV
jgi:hypothetical protein